MEFQILITLSFPPNLFLSLWFYLSLYISPPKCSRLELGSHCWLFLFLGHLHAHSISKSHLVTPLLVLCPILVPAAHFSYQDACNEPYPLAWPLAAVFHKSISTIFAERRWVTMGLCSKSFIAPHTLSTSGPIVLVGFPQEMLLYYFYGQLLLIPPWGLFCLKQLFTPSTHDSHDYPSGFICFITFPILHLLDYCLCLSFSPFRMKLPWWQGLWLMDHSIYLQVCKWHWSLLGGWTCHCFWVLSTSSASSLNTPALKTLMTQ